VNVATSSELAALEKRVRLLEARAGRTGSEWMRLSASPLGSLKLRRLIAAGKINASRVGRLLYVRIDEHDRFLEARPVATPKPKPVTVAIDDAAAYAAANIHMLRRGARVG